MRSFGKLDEDGAIHLAETFASFPRRSSAIYLKMLLICAANMYDAPTPYFTLGRRDLARRAGCSDKTAKRFLDMLADDGVIVELGTVKTKTGEFTKRTFWWCVEEGGVVPETTPPRSTKPRPTTPRVGSKRRRSDTTSEAELQNSGEAARAAIAARFAARERMWGDGA